MEIFRIVDDEDDNYSQKWFDTPEGGLLYEKPYFIEVMRDLIPIILEKKPITCSEKNKQDAVEYRKQGNSWFVSKFQNSNIHQLILNLYTQSIATAPDMSEELAYGYSSRSALLFRLKKYEECIRDCDRSLKITNDDLLKAILWIRKLESFRDLNMKVTAEIGIEAIAEMTKLNLDAVIKDKFIERANSILKFISTVNFNNNEKEKNDQQLPSFSRQTEVPCASSAISIKYNDVEGRHIVANRKIQPGEIIVLEKSYCQFVDFEYKYLFCSHCMQFTWSSIPCDKCIYSIYCSEKCKVEAWDKYHSFECLVLSHLYNLQLEHSKLMVRNVLLALRLLLLSVHEFGGKNKLKDELITLAKKWGSDGTVDKTEMLSIIYKGLREPSEADDIEDVRTKGFSVNGVFESTTYKTIFSLRNAKLLLRNVDFGIDLAIIVCLATYYLTKTSKFLGEKKTPKQMASDEKIKFFGSLLLRNSFIVIVNAMNLKYFETKDDLLISHNYGASINSFCSLFNHSCNPNIISFNTRNNETLVYAKYEIEEGQQLFLSYIDDDYTTLLKSKRMQMLKDNHFFECNCLACRKNWPTTSRAFEHILNSSAQLHPVLEETKKLGDMLISRLKDNNMCYNPTVGLELSQMMKKHAEHFTVDSTEYKKFAYYLKTSLVKTYGICVTIP